MKKIIAGLALLAVFAGTAAAQTDLSKYSDPIEPGNFLLSIGVMFGGMEAGKEYDKSFKTLKSFAYGGILKADYALPVPLTVGIEAKTYNGEEFKTKLEDNEKSTLVLMTPILARVGWHPNFGIRGFDPYITAKAGLGFSMKSQEINTVTEGVSLSNPSKESIEFCIGFGGDIGVRYFFSPKLGAFLEGDFGWLIPAKRFGGSASLFALSGVIGVTWKI